MCDTCGAAVRSVGISKEGHVVMHTYNNMYVCMHMGISREV